MTTFLANLYLRAIAVRDREEGQTMAEYGIILVVIAVVAIVGATALGLRVNTVLNNLSTGF
jgi:Flp pilus assembly pilin Flp